MIKKEEGDVGLSPIYMGSVTAFRRSKTRFFSRALKAFKKEFFTLRNPRVKHIAKPRFVDKANNNMVERLQGSIREREKVLRALKNKEQNQVIDGFRIYYNFIRPHMALGGKTPAEKANIDLGLGRNKWLSLIRKTTNNK